MKKILVTGAKFTGAIELLYGEPGVGAEAEPALLVVDLRGAGISDLQKQYVVSCVPVRYGAGYEQNWGPMTGKVRISTGDVELDFEEDFWKPYNKKVNKDRCLKPWNKMGAAERSAVVSGLGAYLRYLSRSQYRTKADPENYFKKRMWLTDWDNVND